MVAIGKLHEILLHKMYLDMQAASQIPQKWRSVPIEECEELSCIVPTYLCQFTEECIWLRASALGMLECAAHLVKKRTRGQFVLKLIHGWFGIKEHRAHHWKMVTTYTTPRKITPERWQELLNHYGNPEEAFWSLSIQERAEIIISNRRYIDEPYHDPKLNLLHPPPHTTGGAVDVALYTEDGKLVNVGFDQNRVSLSCETFFEYRSSRLKQYLDNTTFARRHILLDSMIEAGFIPHPEKIWHYEAGGTQWGTLVQNIRHKRNWPAIYGFKDDK